jgi:subtilisin family serine protease
MNSTTSFFFLSYIFLASVLLYSQSSVSERVIQKSDQHYLSNTLIIKFKEKPFSKSNDEILLADELLSGLSEVGVVSSQSLFPCKAGDQETELNKISIIKYSSGIDPQILASKISKLKGVEWAEPKFVYSFGFIPNDPLYSSQYALTKIQASDAWNISTGDTSIVIAIIDTGVDWDHPDLAANIWRNWDEIPGNGIDDDFNGFMDDMRGWDFGGLSGTPDNNPMEDRPDHGTHVAGDASAVTDNSVGVASIGFRCKIMAVKTNRDDLRNQNGLALIAYGYEGIKYAADNGAKVINCSWGGGGYSLLGQEIINFATSLGSLVVAAAGNNNSSSPFYPASYQNVLSVAATDGDDLKASFSNYGSDVDVSAPGVNISSTWQNDAYTSGLGTSFSSPIVAGLAGLVWATFPSLKPNQVAEQIRTNCDDINSINPGFINRLGRGRINAYKSLFNTSSKSVRAIEIKFSDELPGGNGNGVLQAGETITVTCGFVNFLSPTTNLGIYLESSNNYSAVQNGVFPAGTRAILDTFANSNSVFTFHISQSVPQNSILTFNLNYLDGDYQDFQQIDVLVNPTYATQTGNDIALTITSKGTLAFNNFPNNTQGDGFTYRDGPNHLFEGALMLATSSSTVSDAARGSQQGSEQNTDFTIVQPFILSSPGNYADVEGTCIFTDEGAGSNKIGIRTKLNSFSFNDLENQNYILLRYDLTNTATSPINNLYAGLFFDWDIVDGNDDFTAYDVSGNFGYAYHIGGEQTTWVASALVSSDKYGFWAINNAGGDGGFGIYDGFTDSEKWQSLSSGIGKSPAGAGDVSNVISGGPYFIQPNETIPVAFTIAAGYNIDELRASVINSRIKYSQIPTATDDEEIYVAGEFNLDQNYPNPFNPSTRIQYQVPGNSNVSLKIFDVLGNEVITLVNEYMPAGMYGVDFNSQVGNFQLASGIYYYQIRAGEYCQTKKMILLR